MFFRKNCFFFAAFIIWLLPGCKKDHLFDCFKSTGNEITEERTVGEFDKIELRDNVNLNVHPGSFRIKVTAGENLIEGITTKTENNTLFIRNENKCNWVRSFKNKFTVDVYIPSINHISCYGSGNINTDTIRANEFTFDSWGSSSSVNFKFNTGSAHINTSVGPADITFSGHIGVLYLYHNGLGPVHGEACQSDIIFMENKGSNDCYVYCTKWFSPKISFIGNIYYKGNPDSITYINNGRGQLIKLD